MDLHLKTFIDEVYAHEFSVLPIDIFGILSNNKLSNLRKKYELYRVCRHLAKVIWEGYVEFQRKY